MTGNLALDVLVGVLLPLLGGGLVGAAVRSGLARVRRGVVVPRGVCELGIAVTWGVVATGGVIGAVPPPRIPLLLGLSVLAVAGAATDLLVARLPDVLTLPAVVVSPVLLLPLGLGTVGAGLAGSALLGTVHLVTWLANPGSVGGGDVKLAAAVGGPLAATGWWAVVLAPVVAAVVVAVVGLVGRRRAVPLGPALLGVTWAVVLLGG